MMFSRPVPARAHSQMPRLVGVFCSALAASSCSASCSSPIVAGSRSVGRRDVSSELGRCSPGTWCDCIVASCTVRLCSGDRFFRSGGVTFLHFSRSFEASRLGGGLAVAVSGEVPTIEIAGLVRRRRRGPALVPSWGRAWRGGGGRGVFVGCGRRGRLCWSELVEGVDLADGGSRRAAGVLRAG